MLTACAVRSSRRALVAAVAAVGFFSASAYAQDFSQDADLDITPDQEPSGRDLPDPQLEIETVESAMSFSGGVDFQSHFISYGLDVWGGGDDPSPFSDDSTIFSYAQVDAAITEDFGIFFNIWGDLNDNVESNIGGAIQEIDLTAGATYQIDDRFGTSVSIGHWAYASDVEYVLDLGVSFDDAGLYGESGFYLSPSVLLHYRFDGNGGQEEALAVVVGLSPGLSVDVDDDLAVDISFPVNVAFFGDEFQGGDSGFGYVSVSASFSVPLTFVAEKYGDWGAYAAATFYHTEEDAIPTNPESDFLTTSFGLSYGF